jgi:hypothetical protein
MVVKRKSAAGHPRISNIDGRTLMSAWRVGKKCPASWRSENRVWTHDNSCKAEQSIEAVRGLLQTTRLPGFYGGMCTTKIILLPWYSRPAEMASRAKQCGSVTTQDASNVMRANEPTTWSLRVSCRLTCICERIQSFSGSERWTKEVWGSQWMLLCF